MAGNIAGNVALIKNECEKAIAAGVGLLVFSELVLCGYPIDDLVLQHGFVANNQKALGELAKSLKESNLVVLLGTVSTLEQCNNRSRLQASHGNAFVNAIAVIAEGKVLFQQAKYDLPNYGVFDEKRIFVAGHLPEPIEILGIKLGLLICEDLWQPAVAEALALSNAELLICINASPYETDKSSHRLEILQQRARDNQLPIIYVNQVGAQDELVFDGASMVIDHQGTRLWQAPAFQESLASFDLEGNATGRTKDLGRNRTIVQLPKAKIARLWQFTAHQMVSGAAWFQPKQIGNRIGDRTENSFNESISQDYAAAVIGLRDYLRKNGFSLVVLGLSGGIDSALVAAMAVDAIGANGVRAVMLNSPYTSHESLEDAAEIAKLLAINFNTISISSSLQALTTTLLPYCESDTEILENGKMNQHLLGIAGENLQSRIRANILMAISNSSGAILLSTSNKSELATGYGTLYGDLCGAFNPLRDIYKTRVFTLAKWRNQHRLSWFHSSAMPVMPERVITKPPSAELRPNQTDQDSLPAYELLDAILAQMIEGYAADEEIIAAGFDRATVMKIRQLLNRAEFKRRQGPIGPKISRRAFGRDRRVPITMGYE